MADKTGNYVHSFYMTGGTLLVAFLIPFVLVFITCKKSRVHPIDVEEAQVRQEPIKVTNIITEQRLEKTKESATWYKNSQNDPVMN